VSGLPPEDRGGDQVLVAVGKVLDGQTRVRIRIPDVESFRVLDRVLRARRVVTVAYQGELPMGAVVEVHLSLHGADVLLPGRVVYKYDGTAGLEFDRSNEAIWSRWDAMLSQFGVRPLTNTGEHRAIPRSGPRRAGLRTGPLPAYQTPSSDLSTGPHHSIPRRVVTRDEPTTATFFDQHERTTEETLPCVEAFSSELPRGADRAGILAALSAREPSSRSGLESRSVAACLVESAGQSGFGLVTLTNAAASWFLLLSGGRIVDAHILPATGYELGDRLFAAGLVTPGTLQDARTRARAEDREIGNILEEMGALPTESLRRARSGRSKTILSDALLLDAGTFSYVSLGRAPYPVEPDHGPRVLDTAWPRVVGDIRARGSRWLHEQRDGHWKHFPVLVQPPPFSLNSLTFSAPERAFVDAALMPPRRLWEIMSLSNLSRTGTTVLVLALEQIGSLRFRDDPEVVSTSVSRLNLIARRAAQARSSNLFEAMGVHWAASQSELERTYTQQRRAFDVSSFPEGMRERFADDAATVLEALDRAWRVLAVRDDRAEYRRSVLPTEVVTVVIDLMMKQAEMSRWRGRLGEAAGFYRRVLELNPAHEEARNQLSMMDGL
jgi:hypothetical protein